jgi:hypothetical protein
MEEKCQQCCLRCIFVHQCEDCCITKGEDQCGVCEFDNEM